MLVQGRILGMVMTIVLGVALYIYNKMADEGKEFKLRKFPALEAIEEAINRAAEMGKPVVTCPGNRGGLTSVYADQTLAGCTISAYAAELAADKGTPFKVILGGADGGQLIPYMLDLVETAYKKVGKEEDFSPTMIEYYRRGFDMAFMGYISREEPGANIMVGPWSGGVSNVMSQSKRHGAIVIGGTGRQVQIPVMAVMVDYILIGEEMFGAAASINPDPTSIGSLMSEDLGKFIAFALLIIGAITVPFGITILADLLAM